MFLLKLLLSLIAIVVATVIAVQNGKAGKDVSNSASQTPTPVVSVQEPEPAPTTDLTFHIDLLQEDVKKAQEDVKKANEELQIAQEELAESEKNLNKYHKALPSGSDTPVDEVIQTAHNALEGCRGKGNDRTTQVYTEISNRSATCRELVPNFYNADGSDNEEAINEYIDGYITKLTEKQNAVNDARAKVEAAKAKVSDAQAKLDEAQAKLDEAQAANEASVTE
ncbi:MAG: hypothetical protein IKN18_04770, partial [Neisseriaceae bacterium]|nr:hypothetical protein [Neisseriaceae bacterium]